MTKLEKRMFSLVDRWEHVLFGLLILLLALALRVRLIGFGTNDINCFVLPWMESLRAAGGLRGLGQPIGEYNVPYMTILALLSYLPRNLWMYGVKAVSILFELLSAWCVMRLTAFGDGSKKVQLEVMALTLLAPHVIFDGALWGQCDAIYTAFLLLSLLAMCKKRDGLAWFFWGWALGFKLQAIFYLPAMLILWAVNRSATILCALAAPASFLLGILPALIAGRPLGQALTIYLQQTNLYPYLTLGMPNLYSWLNGNMEVLSAFGVLFTMSLLLCVAMKLFAQHQPLDMGKVILLFAVCGLICTFFLPKMHERYHYPVFFFLAILVPMWKPAVWLAGGLAVTSTLSYASYLFSVNIVEERLLAMVNLAVLLICVHRLLVQQPLWQPTDIENRKEISHAVS